AAIVRSVINLGHALGLSVVAEGIEEAEQHRLLALWGCDMAQGYHISRPLPAAEFSAWLARGLRPTSVTRQRGRPSSPLAPALPIGARRRS
ncbi:MAG: EAL domain-containing protein, partial [Cellulomonas sp.]|nr:EAL domain-containing protein [Cellulomonas sp.]